MRAAHADCPDPDGTVGLGDLFAEHFARLGELSPYFLERIGFVMRFDVDGPEGGRWDVQLGPDRVRVDLSGRSASPAYRIRVASRWLWPVLVGRTGWEELFLSLRFSAARDPDMYNDYLVGLLKHADAAALGAVERYEVDRDPNETVELTDGERRVEVGRYCPHAGEDLREGAVVTGGVLRCLAHNFEFDLATGACLNARCEPRWSNGCSRFPDRSSRRNERRRPARSPGPAGVPAVRPRGRSCRHGEEAEPQDPARAGPAQIGRVQGDPLRHQPGQIVGLEVGHAEPDRGGVRK